MQLQSPHSFPQESPSRRWFMVSEPVSFCIDGSRLFRYGDYGFHTSQPLPGGGALTEAVPERSLFAQGVESGGFVVVPATLQRNALVQLSLELREQGEGVSISHEVQLRNVP